MSANYILLNSSSQTNEELQQAKFKNYRIICCNERKKWEKQRSANWLARERRYIRGIHANVVYQRVISLYKG